MYYCCTDSGSSIPSMVSMGDNKNDSTSGNGKDTSDGSSGGDSGGDYDGDKDNMMVGDKNFDNEFNDQQKKTIYASKNI